MALGIGHRVVGRIVGVLMASALVLGLCPALASAAALLAVSNVRTVAQVQTDGDLHGVEQRTFVFEEERSALLWPLSAMEADSKLEVSGVRFAHCTHQGGIDGEWMTLDPAPFTAEIRTAVEKSGGVTARMDAQSAALGGDADAASLNPVPEQPSFCVDAREGAVYLFFPPTSGRVIFECDFTVTDAVRAFDDVAELYWDYAPVDAGAESESVNATVQLPMPEGMQAVAGENVFAWGHGAAGTVNVKADGTVAFHASDVRTGQYAQAHILFPQQWLTNLSAEAQRAHSGTRLDDAKAEEEAWTDTWSAWLANSLAVDLVFVGISMAALIAALALFFAFGREPKPEEGADGKSYEAYEAPLIRRLLQWDHASTADLVALILQLVARGAVKIEVLDSPGPLGQGYHDLRFRAGSQAKMLARTLIDQEVLRLLFDVWGEGYASVTLEDVARHAKADKQRFREEMADFANVLSAEVTAAGFFDAKSARVQRCILIAGGVLFAAALLFGVAGGSLVRGAALGLAGLGCLVIGNYTARRTPEGAQVEASALCLADELERMPTLAAVSEELVAYAYALEVTPAQGAPEVDADGANADELAAFWLAPRKGRGGKPVPSFADQLAQTLERWA